MIHFIHLFREYMLWKRFASVFSTGWSPLSVIEIQHSQFYCCVAESVLDRYPRAPLPVSTSPSQFCKCICAQLFDCRDRGAAAGWKQTSNIECSCWVDFCDNQGPLLPEVLLLSSRLTLSQAVLFQGYPGPHSSHYQILWTVSHSQMKRWK